jgi:hypothetical protein
MPLFVTSVAELIEKTHRILTGDWKGGTCTGTGASSLVDTSRTEPDDYFQNTVPVSRVYIWATTDGAVPQGQERTVSDWAVSTGTATVTAAWTTANPATGDKYVFLSEYSWQEIFHALNDALIAVRSQAVIERVDTSIRTIDSVYEYAIPIGFTHLYSLSVANSSGNFPAPIEPINYKIIRGTTTPMIQFRRMDNGSIPDGWAASGYWADENFRSGYQIRLEGYGWQPQLVTDFDLCYIDPTYVANQAAAYLHARRITRMDTEPKGHQAQYTICQQRADAAKPQAITKFPPNTMRVY